MTKKSNTGHDETVRRVAGGLRSQGYKPKADHTDTYPTPRTIYGMRPDVIATKRGKTKIVEVETRESYNSPHSQAQRRAFRRFVNNDPKHREFRTKIVK